MSQLFMDVIERQKVKRAVLVISLFVVVIVVAFVTSMNTGFIKLTPVEVMQTLFGMGTKRQGLILFEFRLPRIVISLLGGMGLAVSGVIFQCISRNVLADPGVLGINAGAGLAVVTFVILFPTNGAAPVFVLPVLALLGGGLTATLIYLLSYKKGEGISPTRLILTGIAVAAGIAAAMIILTIKLDPYEFQFVSVWLAGSVWGSNWQFVQALLPWLLVLIPFVMYKARVLNILQLGDQLAVGLGTALNRERLILLGAAVGLAASCVAVSGNISFVGLLGPHIARRLVGSKHQYVVPVAAQVGAALMVIADTLARWLLQPIEIPTGIVIAVIGAPYFFYLLTRAKA